MAGKTEYIYLQGKAKWFRPLQLNQFGKWSHVLYPNNESLEKIRELQSEGVKNQLKKDEDGYYVSLSRPSEIEIYSPSGKKKVGLTPPTVIDADGRPFLDSVGNGSDVTTKMQVYSHRTPGAPGSTTPGKAKAMRWESTRIDNLIVFKRETDFNEEEELKLKGVEEQPKQLF